MRGVPCLGWPLRSCLPVLLPSLSIPSDDAFYSQPGPPPSPATWGSGEPTALQAHMLLRSLQRTPRGILYNRRVPRSPLPTRHSVREHHLAGPGLHRRWWEEGLAIPIPRTIPRKATLPHTRGHGALIPSLRSPRRQDCQETLPLGFSRLRESCCWKAPEGSCSRTWGLPSPCPGQAVFLSPPAISSSTEP